MTHHNHCHTTARCSPAQRRLEMITSARCAEHGNDEALAHRNDEALAHRNDDALVCGYVARGLQRLAAAVRAALRVGPGIVLTLLLPKCPLCVAALLTSLGLGGALANRVAPWLHAAWFSIGCAAIAAPLIVWLVYTLRAARSCGCASFPASALSEKRTQPTTGATSTSSHRCPLPR